MDALYRHRADKKRIVSLGRWKIYLEVLLGILAFDKLTRERLEEELCSIETENPNGDLCTSTESRVRTNLTTYLGK
jgi:hypothetical protein